MLHAQLAVDNALPMHFAVFRVYFVLFIILKQTTNYANSAQKQPIQQISKGLFPVFFQSLLRSLCIFDKSSKVTGYASLWAICQQEMNGYPELYSGLLYPVPSDASCHWSAGEQRWTTKKNQIKSLLLEIHLRY